MLEIMSEKKDVDTLVDALSYLAHAMTRPKTWEALTKRAGASLDRPSVTILHMLEQCAHEQLTCNVHELAQHLSIEAPSVSRKVQELEQAGLVMRKQDVADRRSAVLRTSAKGRKMLERIQQAKRESLAESLSEWSAADLKIFAKLIDRLATDINKEQLASN